MTAPEMELDELIEEIDEAQVALDDLGQYNLEALGGHRQQLRVLREEARRHELKGEKRDILLGMLFRVEEAIGAIVG